MPVSHLFIVPAVVAVSLVIGFFLGWSLRGRMERSEEE
jgi:hypothetical protein